MSDATPRGAKTPRAEVTFFAAGAARRTSKTLAREIHLKCDGCGLNTSHVVAGIREDGHLEPWRRHDDWREGANRKEQTKLRRAVFVEQFLTAAGVEVYDDDSSRELADRGVSKSERRLFAIARDRRDGDDRWIVRVANDATLDGRTAALQEAARWILCDDRFDAEGDYLGWAVSPRRPDFLQDNDGPAKLG